MAKRILIVTHPTRSQAHKSAVHATHRLTNAGITVFTPENVGQQEMDVVMVLGGDGSILHAAELTRHAPAPILGVNYGHVGFLAETDIGALDVVLEALIDDAYSVDDRLTVDVTVHYKDRVAHTWAMNEVSVEKGGDSRVAELAIGIDGQGISSFSADGVVVSTPTGSTAYAFSGGGPIVWPDVSALLVVPISAHALFARPMVIGPDSHFEVNVLERNRHAVSVWCDGRRYFKAPPGTRIEVVRGEQSVPLVRLNEEPFADRLVRKFNLPASGWRGADTE